MQLKNQKEAVDLLNLGVRVARIMVGYGAEIYRVEDTIYRMFRAYENLKGLSVLVTYNSVIVSFIYDGNNYTTMRRVAIGDKNLEKISLVNDLSRKFVVGEYDIESAFLRLKVIKNYRPYSNVSVVLSLVLSAPFFAIMFGGTLKDYMYSFIIMFLQGIFLLWATKYKIMFFLSNLIGAFLVTVATGVLDNCFDVIHSSSIIAVGLMPLVPGVQITNSVRDFMAGDYVSGMTCLLSAFFIAAAIAVGVVFGLRITG